MAHSYIQAHDDEYEAFRAFARLYPDTTLLVDTYDTLAGVRKVIDLARTGDEFPRQRGAPRFRKSGGACRRGTRLLDDGRTSRRADLRERRARADEIARLLKAGAPTMDLALARIWPCRAMRRVSTSCTSSSIRRPATAETLVR